MQPVQANSFPALTAQVVKGREGERERERKDRWTDARSELEEEGGAREREMADVLSGGTPKERGDMSVGHVGQAPGRRTTVGRTRGQ